MMEKDLEHGGDFKRGHHASEKIGAPVYVDETGAVAGDSFAVGDSWYAKTQRAVGKFGVEQRGIERVPEDERTDGNLIKVGTLVWPTLSLPRETSGDSWDVPIKRERTG